MPFLSRVKSIQNGDKNKYPYNILAYKHGIDLSFDKNVTFFVGENGSGKSTLLEAIGHQCGFNLSGGSKNHFYSPMTAPPRAANLRLSWTPRRIHEGFYMRAESFFNFATYIDELEAEKAGLLDSSYGGKSLHAQSHGESFLSLFNNKFKEGIFILDEPEAALSPSRQLAFMALIHDLEKQGKTQFLIATHSPMLLMYPNATIYSFGDGKIVSTVYQETEHYQLTTRFLANPERYFKHMFVS